MTGTEPFDSFHDTNIARTLIGALGRRPLPRPVRLMHVCGTHEHAIARAGIRSLLPEGMRLVAGPGCPVCVCPASDIDIALEAAKRESVTIATFGDMFRVPATNASLEEAKAAGADVRVVYSPRDAARIARDDPERLVVFMAVGFETTAGPIAASIAEGTPPNFCVVPSLRLIPPALQFLLERRGGAIDGFILPGHVSTVIGLEGYRFLECRYHIPAVIAGFEPIDVLHALCELSAQIIAGPPYRVANLYRRAVHDGGNERARRAIADVFDVGDAHWRGIGTIPSSGLALKPAFRELDAAVRLGLSPPAGAADVPPGCSCHEVILGDTEPESCPLFGTECTPRRPRGPCMVSSEGTCRARHQYRPAPGSAAPGN